MVGWLVGWLVGCGFLHRRYFEALGQALVATTAAEEEMFSAAQIAGHARFVGVRCPISKLIHMDLEYPHRSAACS